MVPRRAGEAKGKGPKKPSEAKEYPPNAGKVKKAAKRPAEVQRAPPKPGAATEKAHKQGGTAKDTRPQPGKARKAPPSQTRPRRPLPVPAGSVGRQRPKAAGAAEEMLRTTGKPKLGVGVQNPLSARSRTVLLPQPEGGRPRPRLLKGSCLGGWAGAKRQVCFSC